MNDIREITTRSPEWPTWLSDLADPPGHLYVKGAGDLAVLTFHSVAVVGSRACTEYGAHVASGLGYTLGSRGLGVVSGGAFGIDAAAHRGALSAHGPTVAVLASGLNRLYPRDHDRLFEQIAQRGLLVSEYPPDAPPSRERFIKRNRLIAALTRATVVVEAAVRSGSLNTAAHAMSLDRPLYAVPGPVTSAQSGGTNLLIRDRNAKTLLTVDDLVADVPLTTQHEGVPA